MNPNQLAYVPDLVVQIQLSQPGLALISVTIVAGIAGWVLREVIRRGRT